MNLTAFLVSNKVYFQFLKKRPTRHALEASKVSGVTLDEIVKTIVFIDQDSKAMIAVVQGDRDISRHKFQHCSNSKSVRLASDDIAKAVTGYATGGIPPVGHKKKLPVFIDVGVMRHEYIWCGGGARSKLVRLRTEDIVKLSAAKIGDISTD